LLGEGAEQSASMKRHHAQQRGRGLEEYTRKRDFERTAEPSGRGGGRRRGRARPRFVVQQHAARRMHYDFRLEQDGVLKSWAIPKGPSLDTGQRRMAVETEDHPLEYAGFEGSIPKGEYGGGTVLVWDRGTWEPIGDPRVGLAKGKLEFRLSGEKLRGRWHLVRMRPRPRDRNKKVWLLIKGRDEEARHGTDAEITERAPKSVLSGRALGEPRAKPEKRARGRPAPLPRAPRPQLATLVDAPPDGPQWLHELKLDGYRILARIQGGKVRLLTRSGNDWTGRLPGIAQALASLPVENALLDGEVVALDSAGRSRFQLLQGALQAARTDLHFYVFDLLHRDGDDLGDTPLVERKAALHALVARLRGQNTIRVSEHVQGDGAAFLAEVCRSGGEGIVSKLATAPYRAGRARTWLKVKCGKRQEFVVVGYTAPRGSRVGLGALLLGVYDDAGKLRYSGKVGTGFGVEALSALRRTLGALGRETPAVVDPRRAQRDAHWVTPKLVAEVAFTEWTDDGKVRHPSFIALRSDKPAAAIRREVPEAMPKKPARSTPAKAPASAAPSLRAEVAGVRLSSPDRVYFPDLGVTKSELAQYYETMAERVLPGLAHRPLSLVRCPESTVKGCFYQKHATDTVPDRVSRVVVEAGEAPYAMVTDLPSLISLVQIAVIEFHVWGARADQLERPDLFVLDLDPDPSVPWPRLAATARLLRSLLQELGFVPFLRTTGGKGLHVVVPLVRRSSWEEVKAFTHAIALRLVREAPDQFTAQISKTKRKGKILIDYLRNQREATAIASYSVRARPGAPVAAPLAWDELEEAGEMPSWSVRRAPERLVLPDPWQDFEKSRRALTARATERLAAL
jgi:bifunctional non-homologous end joining protein LigD